MQIPRKQTTDTKDKVIVLNSSRISGHHTARTKMSLTVIKAEVETQFIAQTSGLGAFSLYPHEYLK